MSNNASPLVKALEDAWIELQSRYPEIPDVVVVLGTGQVNGKLEAWGSWTTNEWSVNGKLTGEFMLAGEAASKGAEFVLETLIHEAAHALNAARGIKDTSRQGRYHNQHYADAAIELDLSVEKDATYGWLNTAYIVQERDRKILRSIEEALKLELPYTESKVEDNKPVASTLVVQCACPRKFRAKEEMLEEGAILCSVCGEEFLPNL